MKENWLDPQISRGPVKKQEQLFEQESLKKNC